MRGDHHPQVPIRDGDDPPSLRATTSIPPPPPPSRARSGVPRITLGLAVAGVLTFGVFHFASKQVAERVVVKVAAPPPEPAPKRAAAPKGPRADANLDKSGHTQCAGGFLVPLPELASEDGQFDLVIHAHGASDLVAQSAGTQKLNAVIVAFSLGIGSGHYDEFFGYKPRWQTILDQAEEIMQKRGLEHAKVRRVALSAFSAGFSGVERMLEQPGATEKVDAVLLYDALHASYDERHQIDFRRIEAVAKFAGLAAKGDKLFYSTHSDIKVFEYASTHVTADALLEQLGITRQDGGETPASVVLPSLGGEAGNKLEHPLAPLTKADKNGFHLRGFAGEKAEDHLAHLHQMATTGFPMLAERWQARR